MHCLNAFKRDVDFFADEDALVHVKLAPTHIEGEPPKVEHGAHKGENRTHGDGP